jgi:hypothetical protein
VVALVALAAEDKTTVAVDEALVVLEVVFDSAEEGIWAAWAAEVVVAVDV